jgi:hypothetical protein
MTGATAAAAIVLECAAEMVAVLNKHFYWRKGWKSGDKEVPKWVDRLLFG